MRGHVGSALGCGLFGALAGAAAMILLYSLDAGLVVEMSHDRPGLLHGFYNGERLHHSLGYRTPAEVYGVGARTA